MTPKITKEQLDQFMDECMKGAHPGERFGQAFMNRFATTEPCPEIYYEANTAYALKLIQEKYVIQEEPEAAQASGTET
jgi:hypothetical protein